MSVYTSDPWFEDKRVQVIEEIKKALSRQKHIAGLVIAGISAFVTTTVVSVALSQSTQTAGFVPK